MFCVWCGEYHDMDEDQVYIWSGEDVCGEDVRSGEWLCGCHGRTFTYAALRVHKRIYAAHATPLADRIADVRAAHAVA